MRATACLCALLGALLALPAGVAEAKITPLPRPAGVSAKPGTLIAPVSRPDTRATIRAATKAPPRPHLTSTPRTLTATAGGTARVARSPRFVPVAAGGGRERGWIAPSGGGRDESALAAATAPAPTPLALVGAGELLPTSDDSRPSWLIPLLALLAAAECFALVQLARGRLAHASEI